MQDIDKVVFLFYALLPINIIQIVVKVLDFTEFLLTLLGDQE